MKRCKVSLLAAALVAAAVAQADIMSLNIQNGTDVSTIVDGAETFGVSSLNTVVDDWNSTSATSGSNLILDDGSTSSIGFTANNPVGISSGNNVYNNTAMRAGFVANLGNDSSITINNLNANFTEGYYAIVYFNGYNNAQGSVSDGSETFFFKTDITYDSGAGPILTTQTTDLGTGNPIAEYALFGSDISPLSADSITFTLNRSAGTPWIGGVQIVAIPEPSALGLIGCTFGGMLLIRRFLLY